MKIEKYMKFEANAVFSFGNVYPHRRSEKSTLLKKVKSVKNDVFSLFLQSNKKYTIFIVFFTCIAANFLIWFKT